ncbi:MAG TPA: hypothetical protein VFY45_19400 [Baekduia sp.]|nr:hypothetical protein [Baekduia sp.]
MLESPVVLSLPTVWHRRMLSAAALLALVVPLASAVPADAALSPGGRVYEQVSPVEKYGAPAGAGGQESPSYGIAAKDGNGVFYDMSAPVGNATRGVQTFAVGQRSATGWSAESRFPLPPGPVNFIDYLIAQPWPSEDLSTFAYQMNGGGIVPGNPSTVHFVGEPAPEALYRIGPGGALAWLTEPSIASPNPAVGQHPGAGFVLSGGSADLSTVYFTFYGTLIPQDASRAPHVTDRLNSPWGFYRYSGGHLESAGVLPDGTLDPYGAIPAGAAGVLSPNGDALSPPEFRNQVSHDGSRAFFVSPDPRAGSGRVPQLYVRKDGTSTVLVSRSAITGDPAPHGAVGQTQLSNALEYRSTFYAYGSRDGSHVYFQSVDPLTADAPSETTTRKAYIFDVDHGTLTYLPGVRGEVLAASDDLSRFLYADTPDSINFPFDAGTISVWADGHSTLVALREAPAGANQVTEGRAAADGSSFVFQSAATLGAEFNHPGQHMEVYRYDLAAAKLSCLSCARTGDVATRDSVLSHNARSASAAYLSGQLLDNRGMSRDGKRVFFDTVNALVPRDSNGQRDVYVWEDGKVQLVSSGVGSGESNILDSSESGDDVFFATTEGLVDEDRDGEFDVYDARVGGGFSTGPAKPVCVSSCRTPSAGPAPVLAATVTFAGLGNLPPAADAPSATAKPKVSKVKTVRGTSASLKVQVPGKGVIGVSGSGLAPASKQAAKAGSYAVTVRLSKGAQRTLARKHRLTVRVTVRFTPAVGKASSASVSVAFVSAVARRAAALSSVSRKGR